MTGTDLTAIFAGLITVLMVVVIYVALISEWRGQW